MSSNQSQSNASKAPPRLAPPGAGIPLPARIFLRLWVTPMISKRADPARCRMDYEKMTKKLIERIHAVPEADRNTPILVNPIQGLEDSSRYWSLNGVLEHLLTVSKAIESVILTLAAEQNPEGEADPAKVKPKGGTSDFLKEFEDYAPELMKRIDDTLAAKELTLSSKAKFRHPWFGMLNAKQWYWLLSRHQAIHCRQAKEIIEGLKRA